MLLPRNLFLSRISTATRHHSQAAAAIQAESYTAPTHPLQSSQQQSRQCIREKLRELFRETAQPVAVVTSFMPHSSSDTPTQTDTSALHHGATLSSFTSIAMDPYPLVTFALRIPSRMATTLNTMVSTTSSSSKHKMPAHMVINLLSSTQAQHAVKFSRPDLHPTPFADPEIPYTLSQDGMPILDGCLGAISCRLVGPGLPLYDLDFFTDTENTLRGRVEDDTKNGQWQINGDAVAPPVGEQKHRLEISNGVNASELFIAQVMRVEALASAATLPLLYHRRKFTSCLPCLPGAVS
jgi:flavin reductase (DIM6/NTAB) family NADH-FMN oxidoreductase RutF